MKRIYLTASACLALILTLSMMPLNAQNNDVEKEAKDKKNNNGLGGGKPKAKGEEGPKPKEVFGPRTDIKAKPHNDRVQAALQWLADHQNRRGFWSPDKFDDDSIRVKKWKAKVTQNIDIDDDVKKEADTGLEQFNVGLTGLTLLAFVADGNTLEYGKYKDLVKRATRYLLAIQSADGCFGNKKHDDYVYEHAVAATAIIELYAVTDAIILQKPAQLATDFILNAQNPGLGWRYGVKTKENDTSISTWMTMALYSAKKAKLKGDFKAAFKGANTWLDKIEGKNDKGHLIAGYNTPAGGNARPGYRDNWAQNATMNACDILVRLSTSKFKARSREISQLKEPILNDLPKWRGEDKKGKMTSHSVDFYYWYQGTMAAYQVGGSFWAKWEKALIEPILLKYQRGWHPEDIKAFDSKTIVKGADAKGAQGRHLLDEHGSWDPIDPWGVHGGRVYATAINCLTLQTYHRYQRIGEKKKVEENKKK